MVLLSVQKRCPYGLVVALILALMNPEPMLISEVPIPTDGKTVLLVDASASMSVESGGKSRFERANQVVSELQGTLEGQIEVWYFDGALQQGAPSLAELGQQSDLLQGLKTIRDRYLGQVNCRV